MLNRSTDYISNRRSLLTKWIYPTAGDVLVRDWSTAHSETILSNARSAGLGACRVEDLGSTLSGMRRTAHRKRDGGRWLSKDEDPLEEVSYGRSAQIQGAHRTYVRPAKRPSIDRVLSAISSAKELDVWDWMPDIISYAAFSAPRLSEQLGLRAIDVDLRVRNLEINGVWRVEHNDEVDGDRRERYSSIAGQSTSSPAASGTPFLTLSARCSMRPTARSCRTNGLDGSRHFMYSPNPLV
jgi:hypothetical protein